MMPDRHLEAPLERLLRIGTIVFSAVIGMGVLIDAIDVMAAPIDLVTIGIVGFIVLPVVRVLVMLAHYIAVRDIPMMRVTGTVITLVIVGVVLGIVW